MQLIAKQWKRTALVLLVTLAVTVGLILAFGPRQTAARADDPTVVEVTTVYTQDTTHGGYGRAIDIYFTPGTDNMGYWTPARTDKLIFRDTTGAEIPSGVEVAGNGLVLHRGANTDYTGYTLTIEDGYVLGLGDGSVTYPYVVSGTKTFLCDGGAAWREIAALPTPVAFSAAYTHEDGWGKRLQFNFSPDLSFPNVAEPYRIALKNDKIEVRDAAWNLVTPAVVGAEMWGNCLIWNRTGAIDYTNHVVTIKKGFVPELADGSVLFPYVLSQETSFISTDGSAWTPLVAATDITLDLASQSALALTEGQTHQVTAARVPEGSNAPLLYTSSAPAVASVSSSGLISAVSAGEATVTVRACGITKTVAVTVAPIGAAQTGIRITAGKALEVYRTAGYKLSDVKAQAVYDTVLGAYVDIAQENVSGTFNKDVVGLYTLTVTVGGFSDTFTVNVISPAQMTVASVYAQDIGYGLMQTITFSPVPAIGTYWTPVIADLIVLRDTSGAVVPFGYPVEVCGDWIVFNRQVNMDYRGYTLTVGAGFIPVLLANAPDGTHFEGHFYPYEVSQTATFINTGAEWVAYVPATGLTLDPASVALSSLEVGVTHQIVPALAPEGSNEFIGYSSSAPAVAIVSAAGLITAVSVGTAVITVKAGAFTQTVSLTVTPERVQTGIRITAGKTLSVYRTAGYKLSDLTVQKVYGETLGALIDITAENISGTFNKDVAGGYTLTVTAGGFTDTFIVTVTALTQVALTEVRYFTDWGGRIQLTFTPYTMFGGTTEYRAPLTTDKITLRDLAGAVVVPEVVGAETWGNCVMFNRNVTADYTGYTITVEAGFIPVLADGTVIPYETTEAVTYVCKGASWIVLVVPTDFTVSAEHTSYPVGASVKLTVVTFPEGTYGTPAYTSSAPAVAVVSLDGQVDFLSAGMVTITAVLQGVTKTISFTVTAASAVAGIELTDAHPKYYFLQAEGEAAFAPVVTQFRFLFEDGNVSKIYTVPAEDVVFPAVDTTALGVFAHKGTLSYGGVDYEVAVPVEVYAYYDQEVTAVSVVDWFIYATFIIFGNTSTNLARFTEDQYFPEVKNFLTYERADGTAVPYALYFIGERVVVMTNPINLDQGKVNAENWNKPGAGYYEVGDMITVKAGLPMYKWTGALTADADPVVGMGESIIEGYVQETVYYQFTGNGWAFYKEYDTITASKETIELACLESASAGVFRDPIDATTGKLWYASSDEEIATVTENGIITAGTKAGTADITVTIKKEGREDISVVVHIVVYDKVTGLEVTGGRVKVTQNGTVDLSAIQAKLVYSSGNKADFDLSSGTLTLDTSAVGDVSGVLTITVSGREYKLTLPVTVSAPDKKGCKSSCGNAASVALAFAAVGLVFVFRKKK